MTINIDRNTKVMSSMIESVDLANKLRELSSKSRWTEADLILVRNVANHLFYELTNLGLCTGSTTRATNNSGVPFNGRSNQYDDVAFVRVGGIIRRTINGATIFSIPGFKGGYYKDENGPMKREDNVRSIPNKAIVVPLDPVTGLVGIDRNWYEKPAQRDLRDYVSTTL